MSPDSLTSAVLPIHFSDDASIKGWWAALVDPLCSRNARPPKVRRKGVRRFFAPGARVLRRASLDGRSRKLLTSLLGWVMNWERVIVYVSNGD
jgi:hypothetical protein